MTRRAGVTLVEVLVSIMIVGVGLLAVMTLFPLGAMEMMQSARDDRMGHIKHNAAIVANVFDARNDATVRAALLTPGGGLPAANATDPSTGQSYPNSPSYPVFIDPFGWYLTPAFPGAPTRDWVGTASPTPGVFLPRRVSFSPLSSGPVPQLYRWCFFLDEINFPRNVEDYPGLALGAPCPPGGLVERSLRYSWAYLAQIPAVSNDDQVDLSVVVYSGRQLDNPTNGEVAYPAAFNAAGTATLVWGGAGQPAVPPDLTVGNWILNSTIVPPNPTAGVPRPVRNATFHRVVGINQTGGNSVELELLPPPPALSVMNGVAIVMGNVVEVYFRGSY